MSAAVAWQLLQVFGALLVGHELKHATALNGVFGLVLGLVAWLYVTSVAITLSVELNVVLAKRLWPRALLTPFTDDVDLTRGDRRSYADSAKAQRAKGFEPSTSASATTAMTRTRQGPQRRPVDGLTRAAPKGPSRHLADHTARR